MATDLLLAASAWSSDSLARAVPPSCGRGIDPAPSPEPDREDREHPLQGRQTVCSARCRRIRSRLREAEWRQARDREIRAHLEAAMRLLARDDQWRFDMTDLERLGLALVGFPVAVVAAGVLLGLIGAWITRGRR